MYVKVTLLCRCEFALELCVPTSLEVPDVLRCAPGGPIEMDVARSDICCPRCRASLCPSDDVLRSRVEDEIFRCRGTHQRASTVVLGCR
jgi:hypothetical protein